MRTRRAVSVGGGFRRSGGRGTFGHMGSTDLPARKLADGSIQVGRRVLESILDRLPPPTEMRCRSILGEARFDTIWLNRHDTHPFALRSYDYQHVADALGIEGESREEWTIRICQCGFPLGATLAAIRLKTCPDCGAATIPVEDVTRSVSVVALNGSEGE